MMAAHLTEKQRITISPSEVFIFLLFHELAHGKGYHSEEGADMFASMRLSKHRGYDRQFVIQIDLDGLHESVRMAVHDAFKKRK